MANGGALSQLAGTTNGLGSADTTGSAAWFNTPIGVAFDGSVDVYVADTLNHTVRRITSEGVVSTWVGTAGNGTFTAGDLPATVNAPTSVAVLGGKVYIASRNAVLKVQAK